MAFSPSKKISSRKTHRNIGKQGRFGLVISKPCYNDDEKLLRKEVAKQNHLSQYCSTKSYPGVKGSSTTTWNANTTNKSLSDFSKSTNLRNKYKVYGELGSPKLTPQMKRGSIYSNDDLTLDSQIESEMHAVQEIEHLQELSSTFIPHPPVLPNNNRIKSPVKTITVKHSGNMNGYNEPYIHSAYFQNGSTMSSKQPLGNVLKSCLRNYHNNKNNVNGHSLYKPVLLSASKSLSGIHTKGPVEGFSSLDRIFRFQNVLTKELRRNLSYNYPDAYCSLNKPISSSTRTAHLALKKNEDIRASHIKTIDSDDSLNNAGALMDRLSTLNRSQMKSLAKETVFANSSPDLHPQSGIPFNTLDSNLNLAIGSPHRKKPRKLSSVSKSRKKPSKKSGKLSGRISKCSSSDQSTARRSPKNIPSVPFRINTIIDYTNEAQQTNAIFTSNTSTMKFDSDIDLVRKGVLTISKQDSKNIIPDSSLSITGFSPTISPSKLNDNHLGNYNDDDKKSIDCHDVPSDSDADIDDVDIETNDDDEDNVSIRFNNNDENGAHEENENTDEDVDVDDKTEDENYYDTDLNDELNDEVDDDDRFLSVEPIAIPEDASERLSKRGLKALMYQPLPSAPVLPGLIASLFAHSPPVIRFTSHEYRIDPLPICLRKNMKWKLSSITPIIVRTTVSRSGWRTLRPSTAASDKEGDDNEEEFGSAPKGNWLGIFGKHMKSSCFRHILPIQKVNHFPGSFQMGRKDRLWRNLSKMQAIHSRKKYDFFPQTFVLPADLKLLKRAWDECGSKQKWIIKPPASARGNGIRLASSWKSIPKRRPLIVQKYIGRPYLINGRKFDLRLYVYITSVDPMIIYLYDEGLTRFASSKYNQSQKQVGNKYIHLTNYSINKKNKNYIADSEAECSSETCKWSLSELWTYLAARLGETKIEEVKRDIEDLVVKTVLSVEGVLVSASRESVRCRYSTHELFGFDVLLDHQLKPWIIEVNISPSLHSNSNKDISIKGPMVADLLNIAGYHLPPSTVINNSARESINKYLNHWKSHLGATDLMISNSRRNSLVTNDTSNSSSPRSSVTASSGLLKSYKMPRPNFTEFLFDSFQYTNQLSKDEKEKHQYFIGRITNARNNSNTEDSFIDLSIFDILTPDDCRILMHFLDEKSRRGRFKCLFPTWESGERYSSLFDTPRYYNILLNTFLWKYRGTKEILGISLLQKMAASGLHLKSPSLDPSHRWTAPSTRPGTGNQFSPSTARPITKSRGSQRGSDAFKSAGGKTSLVSHILKTSSCSNIAKMKKTTETKSKEVGITSVDVNNNIFSPIVSPLMSTQSDSNFTDSATQLSTLSSENIGKLDNGDDDDDDSVSKKVVENEIKTTDVSRMAIIVKAS